MHNVVEKEKDTFSREVVGLLYRLKGDLEACDEVCLAHCGVTASQGYTLLALPSSGSLSMNELSESMNLAGSTMTRMLDNLVKKGLAFREHDEADRRIVRVGLTIEGQKLQKAFSGDKQAIGKAVLSNIQPGDQRTVLGAMKKLSEAIRAVVAQCQTSCFDK
jgi:DNA-binding MarR family transcriptional regulator